MKAKFGCFTLLLLALVLGCGGSPASKGRDANSGSSSGGGINLSSGGGINVGQPTGGTCPTGDCTGESEPGCGDGLINQASEQCDDGNSLPGDGCSGICKVEPYFSCPQPGKPCASTIACGDGVIGPGEACDDGNQASGDGCAERCNLVEKGFICRAQGKPCDRVFLCGDAKLDPIEGCDDGNNANGDGCDSHCRMEIGFKCSGSPSTCTATVCGDGIIEGAESCDDGNQLPFDGCSDKCRAEPDCKGGACTSRCGDGVVLGEDCDDGNLRDGDGCSSDCKVEDGHKCSNEADCSGNLADCKLAVSAVYRDFDASTQPDFEPGTPSEVIIDKLVLDKLDADGKPVWAGDNDRGHATPDTFRQWYRDVPGLNARILGEVVLYGDGKGKFVNRWGANGEQFVSYTDIQWCGAGGSGCDQCAAGTFGACVDPCTPWKQTEAACGATPNYWDGNGLFFPIDDSPLALKETRYQAQESPPYSPNWDVDPSGKLHNFHFTTEIHHWFRYDAAQTPTFDFTGDDDVWVFVNKQLAADIGGWHPPKNGSFTVNAAFASKYGLENGKVYELAIFHAERKTTGSSFKLTLQGFNATPSYCGTDCGDGKLAAGEECDDGSARNKGGYNECAPSCTLGPRCGDGLKQEQYGEECDDGLNDGSYGHCAPDCKIGPHCGDGIVQPEYEACDDGVNAGGYGQCAAGCVLGPHCGDGKLEPGVEQCDDGNQVAHDGCNAACKTEGPR